MQFERLKNKSVVAFFLHFFSNLAVCVQLASVKFCAQITNTAKFLTNQSLSTV